MKNLKHKMCKMQIRTEKSIEVIKKFNTVPPIKPLYMEISMATFNNCVDKLMLRPAVENIETINYNKIHYNNKNNYPIITA